MSYDEWMGEFDLGAEQDERLMRRFKRYTVGDVKDGQPFFILWNPESDKPPRFRMATQEAAVKAALNMAQKHKQRFFVCVAVAVAKPAAPPVELSVMLKSAAPKDKRRRPKRK